MRTAIKKIVEQFIQDSKGRKVVIISHYDTDGITSAAILGKALQRIGKEFSIKIVKQIEESTIKELPKNRTILFVDLASNSLEYLKEFKSKVFILDHHEIISEVPENVTIINPHLFNEEEISGAGVAYLFAKELAKENIDLAHLAVIGMVGDMLEKAPGKNYNEILKDSKVTIKKGLIMYPATRPVNKVLEYSSDIYIPEVTGSYNGAINFLKEIGIERTGNHYKSLMELNKEETSKLITAISLKSSKIDSSELIGNIYLVNFFNKMEDARQISAIINACSRQGEYGVAIGYTLQDKKAKEKADTIYTKHKQGIITALNSVPFLKKIENRNYLIINAEDKIKDTIIGTVASILSNSREYEEGKAIIAMAYNQDKIKVSARMVGKSRKNIREVLNSVVEIIGGEVGGHHSAAGCLIERHAEDKFIEELKKKLELELVKM